MTGDSETQESGNVELESVAEELETDDAMEISGPSIESSDGDTLESVDEQMNLSQVTAADAAFAVAAVFVGPIAMTKAKNKPSRTNYSRSHHCDTCEFSTKIISELFEHRAKVHKSSTLCENCNRNFNCISQLKKHIQLNSNPQDGLTCIPLDPKKLVKCRYCVAVFNDKTTRRKHVKNVHFNIKTGVKMCPECVKEFSGNRALRNHLSNPRMSCYYSPEKVADYFSAS